MKKFYLLSALCLTTNAFASIDLATNLYDVYGNANTRLNIICNSNVFIQNTSAATRKYIVGTRVCAQNNGCRDNNSAVIVEPGKSFKTSYEINLIAVFNRVGKKDLDCTNYVLGDEGKSEVKHGFAYIS